MLKFLATALAKCATIAILIANVAMPAHAQDAAEIAIGRRVADVVDIAVAEYSEGRRLFFA